MLSKAWKRPSTSAKTRWRRSMAWKVVPGLTQPASGLNEGSRFWPWSISAFQRHGPQYVINTTFISWSEDSSSVSCLEKYLTSNCSIIWTPPIRKNTQLDPIHTRETPQRDAQPWEMWREIEYFLEWREVSQRHRQAQGSSCTDTEMLQHDWIQFIHHPDLHTCPLPS